VELLDSQAAYCARYELEEVNSPFFVKVYADD
jgi:hypothetical protein